MGGGAPKTQADKKSSVDSALVLISAVWCLFQIVFRQHRLMLPSRISLWNAKAAIDEMYNNSSLALQIIDLILPSWGNQYVWRLLIEAPRLSQWMVRWKHNLGDLGADMLWHGAFWCVVFYYVCVAKLYY